jgi:hypothetical protein
MIEILIFKVISKGLWYPYHSEMFFSILNLGDYSYNFLHYVLTNVSCTKRLVVTVKTNLLLRIIYKYTKTLLLFTSYLQAIYWKYKHSAFTRVIKNDKLLMLGLGWLKLFMRFCLNEITSHCFNKVSLTDINLNIVLSCKIFEHFALQTDPVTEFIKLGFTPFKKAPIWHQN